MPGKHISLDYSNVTSTAVGSKHGVSRRDLSALGKRTKRYAAELADERSRGQLPFMDLPYQRKTVQEAKRLGAWARKNFDNLVVCGIGCTALGCTALGVTDQHSQNQLYVEGPFDKVITFLEVGRFGRTVRMPKKKVDPSLDYLGGHSLNELMAVELAGTRIALTRHQRPNCTIRLPVVDAFAIGQLLYMLEVETAFSGKLYRINPFDQPGVEAAKNAAYALLGRRGFEDERRRISTELKKQEQRVV